MCFHKTKRNSASACAYIADFSYRRALNLTVSSRSAKMRSHYYGKLFTKLYHGSMIGAGPVVFALMPYVIANAIPDEQFGGLIWLNARQIADTFGGYSEKDVQAAIDFLCSPDPKSDRPEEEGRRLVKLGQYEYRVVNFMHYRKLMASESRKESNRIAQQKYRAKQKGDQLECGISDVNDHVNNGHIMPNVHTGNS